MKITCQTCQSKYTVSDEKVQGKTVKIKCRKCGATILVNSSGVTTNGAGDSSEPVGAGGGASFLVNVSDSDQRSMSLSEIVTAYQTSIINADTYVWADGMTDWMPLGQVPDIVNELNAASSAAPAPAPVEPVAAPRAAVKKESARRGQDLFGGGGGREEVATAAAGGGGLSAGLVRNAPGKADENSVLFSLSALTARVGTGGASGQQTANTAKEDSGLIDLKALAEGAGPSASPSVGLMADAAGLFPLGLPAVPTTAPIAVPDAQPKNRAPVFIALGGAVAVAAIVGAFLFMKGGPPPPAPAAAVSVAPPAPEPTPEVKVAEPAPVASASASAVAAAKTPPRYTGTRPPTKAGTTSGGTTSGGGETKPPVKSSGGCGCAPGDLMCAMKCSTKK
jgi:predicted Zn finger-like uncharacterized protein